MTSFRNICSRLSLYAATGRLAAVRSISIINCQNCPYGSRETLIIIISAEWSPISSSATAAALLWKIKHKSRQSMLR